MLSISSFLSPLMSVCTVTVLSDTSFFAHMSRSIKGILGEISCSSRGVKSIKTSGFSAKFILFALAQDGSLPAFRLG